MRRLFHGRSEIQGKKNSFDVQFECSRDSCLKKGGRRRKDQRKTTKRAREPKREQDGVDYDY